MLEALKTFLAGPGCDRPAPTPEPESPAAESIIVGSDVIGSTEPAKGDAPAETVTGPVTSMPAQSRARRNPSVDEIFQAVLALDAGEVIELLSKLGENPRINAIMDDAGDDDDGDDALNASAEETALEGQLDTSAHVPPNERPGHCE